LATENTESTERLTPKAIVIPDKPRSGADPGSTSLGGGQ